MSWTLEDYWEALKEDKFFDHMRDHFSLDTQEVVSLEERRELLETKFSFVGGNAKLMFDAPAQETMHFLLEATKAVNSFRTSAELTIAWSTSKIVNRLFAWHVDTGMRADLPRVSILSTFVARVLAYHLGPDDVRNIAAALASNALMDAHSFELRFFVELTFKGVLYNYYDEDHQKHQTWEKARVEFFDPTCDIDEAFSRKWLSPILWSQGSYDAVFIDLDDENLVRFIQITRAEKHSFKPKCFTDFLLKVKGMSKESIRKVELVHVVPNGKLKAFKPLDVKEFERDVVDPSFGDGLEGSEQEVPSASVQVVGAAWDFINARKRKADCM